MKKNIRKLLVASFVILVLICACIFTFLGVYMNQRSSETISGVGEIYMEGMSERISRHFETTMEYRLSFVEGLVRAYAPGRDSYLTVKEKLAYGADIRDFDELAFYTEDGEFDMICGGQISVVDEEPFLNSLKNGDEKVAVGRNSSEEDVVLLGIPCEYPMEDGKKCIALVASTPIDYYQTSLALDEEENDLMYSHVIRRDGSFVIRSADAVRDNYFERIREVFDGIDGKSQDQIVKELEEAMASRTDYSTMFSVEGERRHLYCTSLPYTEWFLITILPYGQLNEMVNGLSRQWMYTVLGGAVIILSGLFIIFFWYFRVTNNQMRELEDAKMAAEYANRSKSEFLSNMSHDIRTPMNAIVGMTAIAMANTGNEQQIQNCLKKISLSSRQLLGLINDVLDMSKIESGKMTLNVDQVSLREILEGIVGIVQPQVKARQQRFDVSIHDISSEEVCCDSVRLNQVLLNLLSNALKFTPEGGNIRLTLYEEASPVGEDHVRIHVYVEDNGIGMSAEFKEKIFESFTREDSKRIHKTEGTGLGMAITKYIVDAMNGSIEVESEPEKGTRFHIALDLKKAEVQERDMVLPSWKMLVVDDDRAACESTVSSLKAIGVKADWALDGETAVEMAKKQNRKHDSYHVILLDWKLPGMDGVQTAREIRRHLGEEVPILLMSAYDWADVEAEAREAGISGFMSKPLFKSTLFYGLKPFADSSEEDTSEEWSEKKVDFNGKKILLAEDNDLNWEIAEELLTQTGLELERAENGKICVDKFCGSPEGSYDGILMDIRMPVMNGYEAAEAIRAADRADSDIPIIAMTADAFSEDIKKCLDYGMNAHISKPIDMREVVRIMQRYIK